MKCRNVCWWMAAIVVVCLITPVARAVSHEVYAHGAGDRMWVGRFQIVPMPRGGDVEQTDLLVRIAGPGQQWKALGTVASHVQGLASRDGQAVVLLSDGQWSTVWAPDGASTGRALPANADIRALGDDGKNLWAVGAVPGGWAAVQATLSKASTEPYIADADNPPSTTAPATAPSTRPAGPIQDVLFRLIDGTWQPVTPVPAAADELSGGEVALAVAGERVSLATTVHHGSIDVTEWTQSTGWTATRQLSLPGGKMAEDVQFVVPAGSAELWASDGASPGWLFTEPMVDDRSVALSWKADTSPVALPAIAVAGGYVRVIGLHGDKLYEQRYEPNGTAVGEPALLQVPVDVGNSPLQIYLNYGLLAALLLSAGATLYRRSTAPEANPAFTPPAAAPLVPRIAAGLIDALPVIVTVAVVSIRTDNTRNALDRLQELPALIATASAIAFYILHTMTLELLTRRTAGKWLLGLRSISVDGKRASAGQIVLRNVLRVIDLLLFPLAIVLLSPLRQRSSDIAAGTMVVLDSDSAGRTNVVDPSGVNKDDPH